MDAIAGAGVSARFASRAGAIDDEGTGRQTQRATTLCDALAGLSADEREPLVLRRMAR